MTFYVENETDVNYEFNIEEIVEAIAVEMSIMGTFIM